MKPSKFAFSVRLFSLLVILFMLSVNGNSAYAQAVPVSQVAVTKPSFTVNFIGGVGDKLFFEVIMEQPEKSRALLSIRNEDGFHLYNELVTKSTLVKRVQVPKDEATKLEFVFNSGKEQLKRSFEIRVQYKETLEIKDVSKL